MKKTILLIAGLLMFAILATGCLGGTDTPADEPEDSQEEFTATATQEQLDTDIVVKAVRGKNKELCETVENEEQKNDCITRVDNQILLGQAQEEIDIDLCDEISRSSTQDQCEVLVQTLIDEEKEREDLEKYYEETNKQVKEDEVNLDKITNGGPPTAEDCEVILNPEFKEHCLAIAEMESVE